ncbi:MAG: hypothetical protein N7Q72_03245, partial [Spiroplasma sp. Tabriz.8]|nr:hypothetical protein [Spiroplasma sp. Tabriz.8]
MDKKEYYKNMYILKVGVVTREVLYFNIYIYIYIYIKRKGERKELRITLRESLISLSWISNLKSRVFNG